MQGFDEFMNLVMDDAEEVYVKEKKRRQVGEFTQSSMYSDSWHCNSFIPHVRTYAGRILLRGDNITLIMQAK